MTRRKRIIIYLDEYRYEYLRWLATTKGLRIPVCAMELLELVLDAQAEQSPMPKKER